MNAIASIVLALSVSASSALAQTSAAPSAPSTGSAPAHTLLDGTPVKLRLAENLSSETWVTGQRVAFDVAQEVDVDGVPVLLEGASALATVTRVEPKRRLGRGGRLDVSIESARLVDGQKVPLRAVRDTRGGGHIGVMTTAIVGTTILFFPVAPLFLFIHGKAVEIPKGTEVTAFVQGDMQLDLNTMSPPKPYVPVTASPATLIVESNVTGAGIEIDNAFVGSTPSTLDVSSGTHTITVSQKGYAVWSRTMNVAGSGVHLQADLAPAR